MDEHFNKLETCAKYTQSHTAVKLEIAWESENKSLASKLEYHIKHYLTKAEKEKLILEKDLSLFSKNKLDTSNYKLY
jgi:putative endonuclease